MSDRGLLAAFLDGLTGRRLRAQRPSYDEIGAAVQAVLDSGDYELVLLQSGQAVDNPEWRLGKALEKAGLIDAGGVQ